MKGNYKFLCLLAIVCVLTTCKKPYIPPAIVTTNSYLVVEGVINAGSDSTFIKLSRTVKLTDTVKVQAEPGAIVTVESQGTTYNLQEKRAGVYASSGGLNLDRTKKYLLRVKTRDGKEYESDAVEVRITPPIDSISYVVKSNGIDINASTHDASNNTRYYRWDYDETWRFHSKYTSEYKVEGNEIVKRLPEAQVYYCFANDTSSTIVLGSSTKLVSDVISNIPITNVSDKSEKISVRYSINLRQYALTKDSYEFWENLKKNTEQLGSVFDALPSQLIGNIRCISNPGEPVLGYVDVCTVQSKRIFIDESALPNYQTVYPYDCEEAKVYYNHNGTDEVASNLLSGLYIPLKAIYLPMSNTIIGYGRASAECADCTVRGKTRQPDFWR